MISTLLVTSHGVCGNPLPGTNPSLATYDFGSAPIGFTPHLATALRCTYHDNNNPTVKIPGCFLWSLAGDPVSEAWDDSISLSSPLKALTTARIGNSVSDTW